MKWRQRWRRWRQRRLWKRLGQEELVIRVIASKHLLDEGDPATAELVAEVARGNALRATERRMGLVSP